MTAPVSRVGSIALSGIEGTAITVEAAVSNQLPGMAIIGLPDTAVAESKQRVRLAIQQAGLALSNRFLMVNLSPAALPKQGTGFDLAIALAALAASDRIPTSGMADIAHLGELGLDGTLRRPIGLLSAVLAAKRLGFSRVMVPEAAASEAALVPGIEVIAVHDLEAAVAWYLGNSGKWRLVALEEEAVTSGTADSSAPQLGMDISEVVGQPEAIEALTIAAAGRHHISLVGPPGSGKTLLATRLPTILPDLEPEEAIAASSVASLGGATLTELIRRPPFVSPHHTASKVSMIGSGNGGLVHPGALTRANHGVLFLDEAPELPQHVLDALRQPLESGTVEIHRARVHTTLPASVQLVLAANPCPCGNAGVPDAAQPCSCSPSARMRYLARISGPLGDRIDLRLTVRRVSSLVMHDIETDRPTSAQLRDRVVRARRRATARLAGTPWSVNAQVPGSWLRGREMRLPRSETAVLDRALSRGAISVRGYDRILRIAWTIADLAEKPQPGRTDLARALVLREGIHT